MEYEQKEEKSRLYEYGAGKEFATREEAKEVVEKRRQDLITKLALEKRYSTTKIEIVEIENAFQLLATKQELIIFEETGEGM